MPSSDRRRRFIAAELLKMDFFPGLSRRLRSAVAHPLGVLLIAAGVAGLCGLIIHPRVFILASGLAGVATIGACWPWLTLRAVRARIGFSTNRVSEGDSVSCLVEVTNHLPWPGWGFAVRGGFGEHTEQSDLAVRLGSVASRTCVSASWQFHPPRRGEYPQGTPQLVTAFPLGIRESRREIRTTSRLLVLPRVYPVGPVPSQGGDEASDGTTLRNRAGSTGEFMGVRPYRRGDSPRRIHWAQSARHDRLVVCELQSYARPKVVIVLDVDPTVHTDGRDGSREWAIRVAASLAKGWLEQGAEVGMIWDRITIPPRSGLPQADRILEGLAGLGNTSQPLAAVLAENAKGLGSGIVVGVTTDMGRSQVSGTTGRMKWVILKSAGFGEHDGKSVVPQASTPSAWLTIPDAGSVQRLLRGGWAEARHGS